MFYEISVGDVQKELTYEDYDSFIFDTTVLKENNYIDKRNCKRITIRKPFYLPIICNKNNCRAIKRICKELKAQKISFDEFLISLFEIDRDIYLVFDYRINESNYSFVQLVSAFKKNPILKWFSFMPADYDNLSSENQHSIDSGSKKKKIIIFVNSFMGDVRSLVVKTHSFISRYICFQKKGLVGFLSVIFPLVLAYFLSDFIIFGFFIHKYLVTIICALTAIGFFIFSNITEDNSKKRNIIIHLISLIGSLLFFILLIFIKHPITIAKAFVCVLIGFGALGVNILLIFFRKEGGDRI